MKREQVRRRPVRSPQKPEDPVSRPELSERARRVLERLEGR